MAVDMAAILHAFADLAPQGAARVTLNVSKTHDLVWLDTSLSAFTGKTGDDPAPRGLLRHLDRLAAHDELHRHEQRVREGWVFVAGRTSIQGERAELERAGLSVTHRYPVGSWEVDVVVGDGTNAIGLECRVHPDGPAAHLDRHLTLTRAGWRLIDAFPSRWGPRRRRRRTVPRP